jgi:hypothetical protein
MIHNWKIYLYIAEWAKDLILIENYLFSENKKRFI